jgi:hypothetical protein
MNDDLSAGDELFSEMHALVAAILGGVATPVQESRLEELIRQDVGACDLYLKLVHESSMLLDWARSEQVSDGGSAKRTTDPTSSLPLFAPPLVDTPGLFSSSWIVAYLVSFVLIAGGLLVGTWTYISQPVPVAQRPAPVIVHGEAEPVFVGRITGMFECTWADPKTEAFNGAGVPLHRKYSLASGLMEITYDTGARVILQGPCTYEAENAAAGFLSLGRLTASLERKQPNSPTNHQITKSPNCQIASSPLFSVRTPSALVTDLGTAFGVAYDKRGTTRSSVFSGSVRMQALSADGKPEGFGRVLRENESARVDSVAPGGKPVVVAEASANRLDFVRRMPKCAVTAFDLVDVIGGGNGFSRHRNGAVNPANGKVLRNVDMTDYYRRHLDENTFTGDGRYHRVTGERFIDGVFIPNGKQGPVQVDSAGDRFDGFPPTANVGSGWIHGGGVIPCLADFTTRGNICCVLGGIDYSSAEHGVLFIHSNKGITFDLDAVRAADSGHRIVAFRAVAGVCPNGQVADLWVLVDGKPRFVRRQATAFAGAMPVHVPIHSGDRFLTLAATDGDLDIACDLTIFGDPRLELVSDDSGERRTKRTDTAR